MIYKGKKTIKKENLSTGNSPVLRFFHDHFNRKLTVKSTANIAAKNTAR